MNLGDSKKAVEGIIGVNEEKDFIINPKGHAKLYAEKAPELSEILSASDVRSAAEEYEHWDEEANQAQAVFKKWSNRAQWAIFLTACFCTALIAAGNLSSLLKPANQIIVVLLAICSTISGAFAGVCINRIRAGELLEEWMRNRAEAETQRISYFDLVTSDRSPDSSSLSIPLPLFQLEYFRRFQLDVQLAYYEVQGENHKTAATKALSQSTWALGGVAMITGIAGAIGWFAPKWAILSGFALAIQAFASKVTNTEAVNQDRRNAERYKRTRSALAKLKGKLDEVSEGLFSGNKEVLSCFVEAIHEQLSLEHRQWIDSFVKRSSAIGRLEQKLKELKQDEKPQIT